MKIIRLTSENVKRLHAVEISPDGVGVVIEDGIVKAAQLVG